MSTSERGSPARSPASSSSAPVPALWSPAPSSAARCFSMTYLPAKSSDSSRGSARLLLSPTRNSKRSRKRGSSMSCGSTASAPPSPPSVAPVSAAAVAAVHASTWERFSMRARVSTTARSVPLAIGISRRSTRHRLRRIFAAGGTAPSAPIVPRDGIWRTRSRLLLELDPDRSRSRLRPPDDDFDRPARIPPIKRVADRSTCLRRASSVCDDAERSSPRRVTIAGAATATARGSVRTTTNAPPPAPRNPALPSRRRLTTMSKFHRGSSSSGSPSSPPLPSPCCQNLPIGDSAITRESLVAMNLRRTLPMM